MEQPFSGLILLGLIMIFGFLLGLYAERFKLPRVVAYLLMGALFSPGLLGGHVGLEIGVWSEPLTGLLLNVIAFMIGAEISLKDLHRSEALVASTAVTQALVTLIVVAVCLWSYSMFLGERTFSWPIAFVMGAIATATAPAATLAVIDEYHARGILTAVVLGVVAVDDAIGVILFSIARSFVGAESLGASLMTAGREIGGALIVGSLIGAFLGRYERLIHNEDLRLPLIFGAIVLCSGLAARWHFSGLLMCMSLGFSAKLSFKGERQSWLRPIDHVRSLIFLVFFALAGYKFELSALLASFGLTLVYILARVIGKVLGTSLGASFVHAEPKIKRYAGLCLLPQAGVAVGLALEMSPEVMAEQGRETVVNLILGSTIVFELVSPTIVRASLTKASETGAEA